MDNSSNMKEASSLGVVILAIITPLFTKTPGAQALKELFSKTRQM